jgi:hypothetical protein
VVELMPVFQYDPDEGNYWGYYAFEFFLAASGLRGCFKRTRAESWTLSRCFTGSGVGCSLSSAL